MKDEGVLIGVLVAICWVLMVMLVVTLANGCAEAEPLEAFPSPVQTCDECLRGCGGLSNDREAYWCVRNCTEFECAQDGGGE